MKNKALKKLLKMKWSDFREYYLSRTNYSHYYKTLPIDEKAILLQASHGVTMNGNIYYLLKSMATNSEYDGFDLYLACRVGNMEQFRKKLDDAGLERVQLVVLNSRRYVRLLASAKYLMNDTSFYPMFIKRPEQVYLNTWHGTPLKTLGKQVKNDLHNIGNVQKNFLMADYLLYPNEYTMEHMVEDYMLENVSKAKIVLGGYPRNTAFFDEERAKEIRTELEIDNQKVYAFMPTWRGAVGAVDPKATTYVQYYLYEMDKRLNDDEILYVNLHPLARKNVNFRTFNHIVEFPKDYETYEFLNATDCLITDYSSVFYDFAVTRKKCILFTYDEEEYFADRGLYRPLSSLPFPSVKTVDELFNELRSPKNYDDTEFLKEYCTYDCADAAKALCDRVVLGKKSEILKEKDVPNNGKENVIIYAGSLGQNGITTALFNLLNNLDREKRNYFLTFRSTAVQKNKEILTTLPDGINYIATTGKMNLSFVKKVMWVLCKYRKFPLNFMMKFIQDDLKLELKRHYGNAYISTMIQYNGYEYAKILLYSQFEGNNAIFVHSDMYKEATLKNNQRLEVLDYAYATYDHVALVTEDIEPSTASITNRKSEFDISHNLIAYQSIKERGEKELAFDDFTQSNKPFEEIVEILNSDAKKIINVGRFSVEKGQRRLIDSFVRVWKDNPDSYLFIVGGYQVKGLYDELLSYVETLPCADHIVMIMAMSNPMPLVKMCDGSILTSFYEGFGLVLVEADILGVPVVSTDIVGPRTFMQKNGGLLVEDSEAGIEEGIRRLIKGDVPTLTVDYAEYNRNAVAEFEALLKNKKEN